jgi:hypothetical protein
MTSTGNREGLKGPASLGVTFRVEIPTDVLRLAYPVVTKILLPGLMTYYASQGVAYLVTHPGTPTEEKAREFLHSLFPEKRFLLSCESHTYNGIYARCTAREVGGESLLVLQCVGDGDRDRSCHLGGSP